jgi:hypothetical protein
MSEIGLHVTSPRSRTRRLAERRRKSARQPLSSKTGAHEWLTTAAAVPGFAGFAVGRTVFWNALVDWSLRKSFLGKTDEAQDVRVGQNEGCQGALRHEEPRL